MPERRFTDRNRIEAGAFQKDIFCFIRNTTVQAAKNTGDTHSFFRIADHQVFAAQFPFFFIKSDKTGTLFQVFNDHHTSGDLICIKSMQGLAGFMLNEIGDIHQVVDRPQADRFQSLLQPLR